MNFREALVLFVVIAGASIVAGTVSFLPDKAALSPEELAPAAITQRLDKSATSRKEKDLRTSARLLLPLAESGNAEGQFQLGTANEDHENGGKWLLAAAEQGHADAEAMLGIHYCWGVAGSVTPPPLHPKACNGC